MISLASGVGTGLFVRFLSSQPLRNACSLTIPYTAWLWVCVLHCGPAGSLARIHRSRTSRGRFTAAELVLLELVQSDIFPGGDCLHLCGNYRLFARFWWLHPFHSTVLGQSTRHYHRLPLLVSAFYHCRGRGRSSVFPYWL